MARLGSVDCNAWEVDEKSANLVRTRRPPKPLKFFAEPQSVTIDSSTTAFVVVDMQNDFCAKGGYLDYRGVDYTLDRKPIDPINRVTGPLRKAGVPIIWLNWGVRRDLLNTSPSLLHAHAPEGRGAGLGQPIPGGRGEILLDGSWGAQIVDELKPEPSDIFVTKYRYSGFWDTPLDSILRNLGITTLLFGGVNADQCVMSTLQDAMFLGYDCILVKDCAGTTSPSYCMEATLYNVKLLYGFVTDSESVCAGLSKAEEARA